MFVKRLLNQIQNCTTREVVQSYIDTYHPDYMILPYQSVENVCDLPNAGYMGEAVVNGYTYYYFLHTAPIPPLPHPVLTRSEARQRRLTVYWTGKLCKRGHASVRYTNTGVCKQCNRENVAHYTQQSRERARKGLVRVMYTVHKTRKDELDAYVEMINAGQGGE